MTSVELRIIKKDIVFDDSDTNIRIHRALSWLEAAEQAHSIDLAFISSWIGFNALYSSSEIDSPKQESKKIWNFIRELSNLDHGNLLWSLLCFENAVLAKRIVANELLFINFWNSMHNYEDSWEDSFFCSNQEIQSFLEDKNTARYVSAIMQRIYLLRNQLIHGGATHQGRMNRVQVEDCKTLVMKLLPCMISIMMKYPKKNWGELCYPPLYQDKGDSK